MTILTRFSPRLNLSGMFPFGSETRSRNSAENPANLSLSSLLGGDILLPSESGEDPREPSLLRAGRRTNVSYLAYNDRLAVSCEPSPPSQQTRNIPQIVKLQKFHFSPEVTGELIYKMSPT